MALLLACLLAYGILSAWPSTVRHEAYLPQLRSIAVSGNAQDNMAFGARLLDARAYKEAASVFKTAISKGESSTVGVQALAAAYAASGRGELAAEELNIGLRDSPQNPQLLSSLSGLNSLSSASAPWEIVAAVLPVSTTALFNSNEPGSWLNGLADWRGRRNPNNIGSETARLWFAQEPTDQGATAAWTKALLKNYRPFDAMPLVDAQLAKNPNSIDYLKMQGDAWSESGRFSKAAASYIKCLALRPHWIPALQGIGEAGLRGNLQKYAHGAYKQLTLLAPSDPQSWLGLARSCTPKTTESAIALDAYQHVKVLSPNSTDYYVDYAKALEYYTRNDEAEALLRSRLKAAPDDAEAMFELGSLLLISKPDANRESEALSLTRSALAIVPGQPQAQMQLAKILMQEHKTPEAIPILINSLTRDPYNLNGMLILSQAFAQAGRSDLSQKLAAQVQKLHSDNEQISVLTNQTDVDPINPIYHHKLADLYQRVGKFEDAAEQTRLEELVRKDPEGTRRLLSETRKSSELVVPGQ